MSVLHGSDAVIEPVDAEGAHIDRATGGPKNYNKSKEIPDLPSLRYSKIFFVQTVPWDGNLRDVVQEILDENLHASHWVEWKPCTSD